MVQRIRAREEKCVKRRSMESALADIENWGYFLELVVA